MRSDSLAAHRTCKSGCSGGSQPFSQHPSKATGTVRAVENLSVRVDNPLVNAKHEPTVRKVNLEQTHGFGRCRLGRGTG